MKGCVFSPSNYTNDLYSDFLESARNYSDAELIQDYNKERRNGMFGVRAQAIWVMVLVKVLKERGIEVAAEVQEEDGVVAVSFSDDKET